MESPTSESVIESTEIKKDKLSETMESPTATANIENTPVNEANTTLSHRPDSSIPTQETENVVENVENVEQDNNESTELHSPSTQPTISIEVTNNEENSPDHQVNEDNNTENSSPTKIPDINESNENTTTPLPPIKTDTVPEKDNNPNPNSASSTGEAIASAWSSVSNYLWSWFEQPTEENQGENNNANVNNNNNTQNQPTSEEPQSGAGYYANLFSSFFTRTSSDNLNTQSMEKSSSLSSSRLNLLSQQARMSKIQFIGLEDDEEEDNVKPIVDHELSDYIRPHLPLYQRESVKWVLRYSTARHGISLNTLYQKVEKAGPLLVAIRDTENNVCIFICLLFYY